MVSMSSDPLRCPKGHQLLRDASADRIWVHCDAPCCSAGWVGPNQACWTCDQCDYDVCQRCVEAAIAPISRHSANRPAASTPLPQPPRPRPPTPDTEEAGGAAADSEEVEQEEQEEQEGQDADCHYCGEDKPLWFNAARLIGVEDALHQKLRLLR